jgi:DNA-binding response OmpR family regulator
MDTAPDSQPGPAKDTGQEIQFKAVLVVDDDRQLASAIQWILADENYFVDIAYDGEEALLKIKDNDYDVVVCDVMMPKLRGDELFIKARELRPQLADRFIFITGYAAGTEINLFLTKTSAKYLIKPFPMQKLIDCIKQLLG